MPVDVALANRAWESLMTAHTVLLRQFAEGSAWREHGLSMREYDVLYTLAKLTNGGAPARIGELRSGVLLSQPALSRMIDRLAERGLVERSVDSTDKRAVCVRLTPEGRAVQRALGRAHARDVARTVGAALDESELGELARIAGKLTEHGERGRA